MQSMEHFFKWRRFRDAADELQEIAFLVAPGPDRETIDRAITVLRKIAADALKEHHG